MQKQMILVLLLSVLFPMVSFSQTNINDFGSAISYHPPDSTVWKLVRNSAPSDSARGVVMFMRDPLIDSKGRPIRPTISMIYELVDSADVSEFSDKRIEEFPFSPEFDSLSGYPEHSEFQNSKIFQGKYDIENVAHGIYAAFFVNHYLGVEVIEDATAEVFPAVQKDMLEFIKSITIATNNYGEDSTSFIGIDKRIDSIETFADTFPTRINPDSESQLTAAKGFLDSTAEKLESMLTSHDDNPNIEKRLGNVYRMGHNLNEPRAWEKSEMHLKRALSLNPGDPEIYFLLGTLYVNTGFDYAPQAERLFLKAIKLAPSGSMPDIYFVLGLAYYYQGKFEDTIEAVDSYLNYYPKDVPALHLRKFALDRMRK